MTYYDAYLGDTLTANNLTVNVGIRYDDQKGFNAPSSARATTPCAIPARPSRFRNPCIPALNYSGGPTEMHFKDWEPRVGRDLRVGRPEVDATSRFLRAIRGSAGRARIGSTIPSGTRT